MPAIRRRCLPAVMGTVLALAVATAANARAEDAPAAPVRAPWWCQDPPPTCPCPTWCGPDPLLCVPCLDRCFDRFQKAKTESCFRLGAGAYHWWNVQNDDGQLTYGYPGGGEGTYFYHFDGDLECAIDSCAVKSIGAHAQLRARDDTVFRSFFEDEVWFYEGYAFVKTLHMGTFKAGKIWNRFGIDWDGSFWGNVPYYDGFKLDPDFGLAWEHAWNPGKRLSVDAFVQVYFLEDEVNGSLAGADPESTDLMEEKLSLWARAVPTYRFDANTSLALGLSGYVQQIDDDFAGDHTNYGGAVDLTFRWCGLKAYGEVLRSEGRRNPAHYVTGGPSDAYTNLLVGAEYAFGPFTLRATYSYGEYENPGGSQDLLLLGVTTRLTKWLNLHVEYVDWEVENAAGVTTPFEDGWQLVLNWEV